ncbi:amidohydrolase family protein [Telmatocola sphagniphila]|uniref:Amidohydrolase family protein n=1 Tax=Telmatocola sphagniphila TaxID=1123043 RepID=A0A8E6B4P3_9BACT|nr:amidohydrolase family protein [Telmatocola sphagniphila]QVL30453.1 amidohydrolase family protein [Telmatocola sphagniphila]
MIRYRGQHFRTRQPIDIVCREGRIEAIAPIDPKLTADVTAEFLAPGLFDIQINGALGISFNSLQLDEDRIRRVVQKCQSHGIFRFCPTLITASRAAISHGFAVLHRAWERDPVLSRALPGFHLEGPYISGENGPRGAHPKVHVRDPDRAEFQSWQEAAGGRIRLVTLAPELPGAIPFIEWLIRQGVVVAIGHTAASPQLIRDAVSAGARLSTHLGNGSHAEVPRHENYIWEQLASDELMASVIADGHHLPRAVLQSLIRAKMPERIVLTCDASSLAGLPPGEYSEWGSVFEVQKAGRIVVPGTSFLAGSGIFLNDCIVHLVNEIGIDLGTAVDMATAHPARLLGCPIHTLEVGQPAEICLLNLSS